MDKEVEKGRKKFLKKPKQNWWEYPLPSQYWRTEKFYDSADAQNGSYPKPCNNSFFSEKNVTYFPQDF